MDQGCHRAEAELPFEAEPDVDEHGENGEANRHQPVQKQLFGDFGPNEFGAPVLDLRAKGLLGLGHGYLLGRLPAGLALDADQHVRRLAEFLQRHFAKTESREPASHVADGGGFGGAHLDHDAALEVDAVVQPLDGEQPHRNQHQQRRKDEKDLLLRNELEVDVGGHQFEAEHVPPPPTAAALRAWCAEAR